MERARQAIRRTRLALLFAALILYLFAVTALPAMGKSGSIKLLAVTEDPSGVFRGTTADLFIEIVPGKGRVFIETYPLSKIDTQISTRFAKAIACNYVEMDCSGYDFFYTIKADTSIVGGPSAGAAVSLLTSAVLLGLDYDKNISITGTINSGEIIGNVGGIPDKLTAAREAGIAKILLPIGTAVDFSANESLGYEGAPGRKIEVVYVSTLDDAMYYFTGRRKSYANMDIGLNPDYYSTMKGLAERLCSRAEGIRTEMNSAATISDKVEPGFLRQMLEAQNLSEKGATAFGRGDFYTAASYCFGAGVKYRQMLLALEPEEEEIRRLAEETKSDIEKLDEWVSQRSLRTITDLQAYMIVKERIIEARDNINTSLELLYGNFSAVDPLSLGIERLYSAKLWADFFGKDGKVFSLDRQVLAESCQAKISESLERYNYLTAYLPGAIGDTFIQIQRAQQDYESGEYALCMFKASKAKAEADVLLNMIGVDPSKMELLIEQKLEVGRNVIAKASEKDIFPIVGYSYHEYAENLKEHDKYSSLLYAEYSLELSNFDMYFGRSGNKGSLVFFIDKDKLILFSLGLVTGAGLALSVVLSRAAYLRKAKSRRK